MTKTRQNKSWHLSRQINLSTLVQIVLLAGLILGSWVNLQRQLDLLQRDVTQMLDCQKELKSKFEILSEKSISYEYRLLAVEKTLSKLSENPHSQNKGDQ
ncbi:MAG: hypothetical protein WC476_12400 [Phycisphaerae bacterium]|jgi:hypothetical protein